jgi:hypothetical protein
MAFDGTGFAELISLEVGRSECLVGNTGFRRLLSLSDEVFNIR